MKPSCHHSLWGEPEQAGKETPLPARVPIGQPIAKLQSHVLDAAFEPALVGVMGELYLGGAGIARGYLHHAGTTAAAFLPDPFSGRPGGSLYRTGDRARRLPSG